MDETRYSELIASYLSGNISAKERELLFSWINEDETNKAEFEQMQELWALSDPQPEIFEADKSVAWSKIEMQIDPDERPSGKVVRWSFFNPLLRIAAVIAIVAGIGYWWVNRQAVTAPLVEVRTGAGEVKELSLPDGSMIWLNENSTMLYAESFKKREVVLAGEAFFDVERLEQFPFVIKSGAAQTVVLGTSFNVRAYPREAIIEVTVEEGKVALSKPGGRTKAAILSSGEYGVFDKDEDQIVRSKVKSPNATSWKTEKLVFDDTPVSEVKRSLERYYGIDIQVSDPVILDCPFKIVVDDAENKLGEILGAIEYSLGLEIQKQDNSYLLIGSGCQ